MSMTDAARTPLTRGAHHIGLSVPDLAKATEFFRDALGFAVVGEVPDYPARFVSDGATLLTLWQVAEPAKAVPFDRRCNVGLHHLALAVDSQEALERVYHAIADWPDVQIEFGPGPMRPGSSVNHLIAAIPGGIRVEFAMPFA